MWRRRKSWSSVIKIIYLLVAKYQDEHVYGLHHNLCCLSSAVLKPRLYCDMCIWSLSKLACEGTFVAIAMFSEMTQLRTADKPTDLLPPPSAPACTTATEWRVFVPRVSADTQVWHIIVAIFCSACIWLGDMSQTFNYSVFVPTVKPICDGCRVLAVGITVTSYFMK